MQFASTRRKPNCFNLLHQLRLMRDGQEAFEQAMNIPFLFGFMVAAHIRSMAPWGHFREPCR